MKMLLHHTQVVNGFQRISRYVSYWVVSISSLVVLVAVLTSPFAASRLSSKSIKDVASLVSSSTLYQIAASENGYFQMGLGEQRGVGILTLQNFLQMTTSIVVGDHRSLLGNELPGFKLFDSEILVAGEGTNYTNMPIESSPSPEALGNNAGDAAEVQPPAKAPETNVAETPTQSLKTDGDVVYLYFTHTRESFLPQLPGTTNPDLAMNTNYNVTNVGDSLQSSLRNLGIGTAINKTDVTTILQTKKENYASSYAESRPLVQDAIAQNNKLQYFIDIHRDSQRRDVTTIDKNGISFAKIAFVIGGENPNADANMALANAIHGKLNVLVPGISRGVFAKSGKGTNGKFNQDLSTKAILIEVGGVDNNVDELNRTVAIFAEAFSEYYWEAEAVQGGAAPVAK